QSRTQGFVIFHQCASDAVTDSAGLTTVTTTSDSDVYIKLVTDLHQFQGLTNHHTGSFAAKINIQRATVDGNVAAAWLQKHTSCGGFATACTVIDFHDLCLPDYRANSLGC